MNQVDQMVEAIEDQDVREGVAAIVRNARGELHSDLGRARFDMARAHISRLESEDLRAALREELDEVEAAECDYEQETDPRLPDGWTVAVRADGMAIVCSPGTDPRELGWCWQDRETAIAEAVDLAKRL
jgi:hypothetical protein